MSLPELPIDLKNITALFAVGAATFTAFAGIASLIIAGVIKPYLENKRRKDELILRKTFKLFFSDQSIRRIVRIETKQHDLDFLYEEARALNNYFKTVKTIVYGKPLTLKIKERIFPNKKTDEFYYKP